MRLMVVVLLCSMFLRAYSSTALQSAVTSYSQGKAPSIPLLSCYTCSRDDVTKWDNCVTMEDKSNISVVECRLYEAFCKVRRLSDGDTAHQFERSCTSTCIPGCQKYGRIEHCQSCCTQPLCNTGNDAAPQAPCTLRDTTRSFVIILFTHTALRL